MTARHPASEAVVEARPPALSWPARLASVSGGDQVRVAPDIFVGSTHGATLLAARDELENWSSMVRAEMGNVGQAGAITAGCVITPQPFV